MKTMLAVVAVMLFGCGPMPTEEELMDAGMEAPRDAGMKTPVDAGCNDYCQRRAAAEYCITRGLGCPYDAISCQYINGTCQITR